MRGEQGTATAGDQLASVGLITEAALAAQWRIRPKTMGEYRRKGLCPPHIKVSGRVFYIRTVVDEWLAQQLGECAS